jgi:hypothetical protein
MRITLDYRNPSPSHCNVAVFVNGALAGVLTLRQEELADFQAVIEQGLSLATGVANGEPVMKDEASYRAAYWISEDRQHSVRLTQREHSGLSDDALLVEARAEAERFGVDLSTGWIAIDTWTDPDRPGMQPASRFSALGVNR